MQITENKLWTHAVFLVIDTVNEEQEPEASKLNVGAARLSGSRLHVELLPGLSVSGRLVFELHEDDN